MREYLSANSASLFVFISTVVTALVSGYVALRTARAKSDTDNASSMRTSEASFQGNLMKRIEALETREQELTEEIEDARKEHAQVVRELRMENAALWRENAAVRNENLQLQLENRSVSTRLKELEAYVEKIENKVFYRPDNTSKG